MSNAKAQMSNQFQMPHATFLLDSDIHLTFGPALAGFVLLILDFY